MSSVRCGSSGASTAAGSRPARPASAARRRIPPRGRPVVGVVPSGRSAPAGHIIRLGPLGDGDTIGLLATLPHHHGLPAVGPALDAAVGGNPLFAEEYVRMVRDHPIPGAGGVGLPLPESVHGIIAARLQALPAEEKAALQDLSCWAGSAGWATWQRSAAAAGTRPFLERMAAWEFLYWV